MNVIACDVLVIGGGLAAAAAIKCLLEKNIDVCQVVKGSYGSVGRRGAGASSCGASESGSPRLTRTSVGTEDLDLLYQKIIQAGLGMADRKLAAALVEDFPKIRGQLKKWDIRFDMDGPYHLGYPFIHAIESDIRSSELRVFEQTMITDLMTKNGTKKHSVISGIRTVSSFFPVICLPESVSTSVSRRIFVMHPSVPETAHPAIWGLRLSRKYRQTGVRNMVGYSLT